MLIKVAGRQYLVWSSLEGDASKLGYLFCDFHIEPFLCVQALQVDQKRSILHICVTHSTDCGASLGQETQAGNDVLNTLDPIGNLLNIATELLSQSERRRVLHSYDVRDCYIKVQLSSWLACKCVRPILIMLSKDLAFSSRAARNPSRAGSRLLVSSVTAATCMAVGNLRRDIKPTGFLVKEVILTYHYCSGSY
jgi:hypothetical protein